MNIFSLQEITFPNNFLWGAGYSGHQVEGNNENNQIWKKELNGQLKEKSGKACNSYELYDLDHRLASSISLKIFRTSIEWCRIEPQENVFNEKELNHYINVLESAKKNNLKLLITLVHGSIPLWFYEKKGFSDEKNIHYFTDYLNYLIPKISKYVDYWNILNEFNIGGNDNFIFNSFKFHCAGYHVIKQYSSKPVSSAHSFETFTPYHLYDRFDNVLCEQLDLKTNEFFFHAIRTGELVYPGFDCEYNTDYKNCCDYWSINLYTRKLINSRIKDYESCSTYEWRRTKMIDEDFYFEEFYPECITASMARLKDKPIIISENGCCCNDDKYRIKFLITYLYALHKAIEEGADIKGYLYWSLIDNYEWGSYNPKFGLFETNFNTFERIKRPSADFYKEIIQLNGFNQKLIKKYLAN